MQSNQLQEFPWLWGNKITAQLEWKLKSERTLFLPRTGLSFMCEGCTSVVCQGLLEKVNVMESQEAFLPIFPY